MRHVARRAPGGSQRRDSSRRSRPRGAPWRSRNRSHRARSDAGGGTPAFPAPAPSADSTASPPERKGRGEVFGLRRRFLAAHSLVSPSPTTMLRMVPLPRFAGEDSAGRRAQTILPREIERAGARTADEEAL